MADQIFVTRSSEETIARGRELGQELNAPVLLLLFGDLGAGKTTLAKGIIAGCGAAREEEIASPTFTLMHVFQKDCKVYHIDLFRLEGPQDLETLGLEDIFSESAIVLVEWADRLRLRTDWPTIRIRLDHLGEDARQITISDERSEQGRRHKESV